MCKMVILILKKIFFIYCLKNTNNYFRNLTDINIHKNQKFDSEDEPEENMEVEDSKDGVLSKDQNIDSMLNNSRNNLSRTSRRKKSWWINEGSKLIKRASGLNKTHDYLNSTTQIHANQLNFNNNDYAKEFENDDHKLFLRSRRLDTYNIQGNIFNNYRSNVPNHSQSRSSQRYAKTFDTPEELKQSKIFQSDKSEVICENIEDTFDREWFKMSSASETIRKSDQTPKKTDQDKNTKMMMLLDDDEEDDYVRPDEEIMITPSTGQK